MHKGEWGTATRTETLSITDAIESRHSIRRYEHEPIPDEDMQEILRLASLAPSAWNLQPWRFHVVTDPNLKQQLQEAAFGQRQVTMAPVVVLVVSDMEDTLQHLEEILPEGMPPERKQREVETFRGTFEPRSVESRGLWGLTQANIALGFLLLAARGRGYATVPMLGFDQERVKELLGLAPHIQVAAMVPIGVAGEEGYPHHRHPLERIVTYH